MSCRCQSTSIDAVVQHLRGAFRKCPVDDMHDLSEHKFNVTDTPNRYLLIIDQEWLMHRPPGDLVLHLQIAKVANRLPREVKISIPPPTFLD